MQHFLNIFSMANTLKHWSHGMDFMAIYVYIHVVTTVHNFVATKPLYDKFSCFDNHPFVYNKHRVELECGTLSSVSFTPLLPPDCIVVTSN